jgi:uncharacterized protein
MANSVNWFEIPVKDLDRAAAFYEALIGAPMKREVFCGLSMAVFPYPEQGVGGALVLDPRRAPSKDGTLAYLNLSGRLDQAIATAPRAKGEVVLPKTDIGVQGHIAIIRDTEGNLVGLHSPLAEQATNAA